MGNENEHPRHIVEWIERPGAIAACGILECGWIAFYAGSIDAARMNARDGLREHLKTYHAVKG